MKEETEEIILQKMDLILTQVGNLQVEVKKIKNKTNDLEIQMNKNHAQIESQILELSIGQAKLNEKIDKVEAKLNEKIDQVEARLNEKIDQVEARLNEKIDQVEAKLNEKIDKVEARLNEKIDQVEAKLNEKIDQVEARLNEKIDQVEAKLNEKIDQVEARLNGKIDQVEAKLDERIDKLDIKVNKNTTELEELTEFIKNVYEDISKTFMKESIKNENNFMKILDITNENTKTLEEHEKRICALEIRRQKNIVPLM